MIESIYSRRSIRHFKPDPVPRAILHEIIRSGMNAPSAGNEQPWRFLIVDKRELLGHISQFHPHAKMLSEAPVAIMVLSDMEVLKYDAFWIQDCAAATQNMLLTIDEVGLGGVWLGVYPREQYIRPLKDLFNLPEKVIPFSLIALGYPMEKKPANKRFREEWIRWNSWI